MNGERHSETADDAKKATDCSGTGDATPAATAGCADSAGGSGSGRPSYVPTREELLELARYWITEVLDAETFAFFYEDASVFHARNIARRHLERIAEVVGVEAVRKIVLQVENEFRRRMGDRRWEIFQNPTDEEWRRIIEESDAERIHWQDTPQYASDYLGQEAVTVFPELGRVELADALRSAGQGVERGYFNPPPCDHEWQVDPQKQGGGSSFLGFTSVFERCGKCRALRERRIYTAGP